MARAYAALVTLGVIWGTNFIYMKMATGLISPAQTVFLRVLFGFLPLGLMRGGPERSRAPNGATSRISRSCR